MLSWWKLWKETKSTTKSWLFTAFVSLSSDIYTRVEESDGEKGIFSWFLKLPHSGTTTRTGCVPSSHQLSLWASDMWFPCGKKGTKQNARMRFYSSSLIFESKTLSTSDFPTGPFYLIRSVGLLPVFVCFTVITFYKNPVAPEYTARSGRGGRRLLWFLDAVLCHQQSWKLPFCDMFMMARYTKWVSHFYRS